MSQYATREELRRVREEQELLHRFLFGNGTSIGLDEQLRIIQKYITDQEKDKERRRSWWEKFQWVVIPIIIISIVSFLGQFIYFWLTLVPQLEKAIINMP